jgi:ribosomal protein S18 acetylase RimI-like enzyme
MELVRIYLGEECKGRGYGTKLMREVFAEARRQQCETVWLGVDERNVRAREFYERWRFRDVGKKAFPVGGRICTDVLMSAEVRDDA